MANEQDHTEKDPDFCKSVLAENIGKHWSHHSATRATCSDADRNAIDDHQWISSSGIDGSRRNTTTLDPTFQPDWNRTLHGPHIYLPTHPAGRPAAHHPCTCRWFPRPWVVSGRDSGGVAVYLSSDMAADVEPVIGSPMVSMKYLDCILNQKA